MAKDADRQDVGEVPAVEMMPGLYRSTLCDNEETMLCHVRMKKGAGISYHDQPATQNGYFISERVRFFTAGGAGYLFDSNELRGSEGLENVELIECFSPVRAEYDDDRQGQAW